MTGRRTAARLSLISTAQAATPLPAAAPYADLIDHALPPCRPLPPSAPAVSDAEARYLDQLGERVRDARARLGMTRKALAGLSGVSERHLAQLEAGKGNISILLLRQIAQALALPLDGLVRDGGRIRAAERLEDRVRHLPPVQVARSYRGLMDAFGDLLRRACPARVALVGMKGAGRTTLGRRLADLLDAPLVDLDRDIERAARMPVAELLSLCGPSAYARYERQCLEAAWRRHPRAVIVMGGMAAMDAGVFDVLQDGGTTVWVRASAEEHLRRAQPHDAASADCPEVVADLARIVESRTPVYDMADVVVDTTGQGVEGSVADLFAALVRFGELRRQAG